MSGVPQIVQVFATQKATDISVWSWVGYLGISIFWLWFGVERKIRPIVISSLAHLFIDIIMIIAILKFGGVLW
jgi:hypothetical protein